MVRRRERKGTEREEKMELRELLRKSFLDHREEEDVHKISYLIAEGKRMVDLVETTINMTR